MPNLDSPLVPLVAYWIAGNDSKGRKFTGGESGKGLVAGGFGGASAEWAGSQLQGVVGADSMTPQLAQALAGAGVSWAGRQSGSLPTGLTNATARGIHYNVAAQAASDVGLEAGQLFGNLTGGGGSTSASGGTEAMPAPRSRGGTQF